MQAEFLQEDPEADKLMIKLCLKCVQVSVPTHLRVHAGSTHRRERARARTPPLARTDLWIVH